MRVTLNSFFLGLHQFLAKAWIIGNLYILVTLFLFKPASVNGGNVDASSYLTLTVWVLLPCSAGALAAGIAGSLTVRPVDDAVLWLAVKALLTVISVLIGYLLLYPFLQQLVVAHHTGDSLLNRFRFWLIIQTAALLAAGLVSALMPKQ